MSVLVDPAPFLAAPPPQRRKMIRARLRTVRDTRAKYEARGIRTDLLEQEAAELQALLPTSNRNAYRRQVWAHTEAAASALPGIEARAFRDHHIDHVVPIAYGFRHGIDPALIGSASNLRMLPAGENLAKGASLTEDAEALLAAWSNLSS